MLYSYPSNLFAVVVVYNKSLNESKTITNLLSFAIPNLQIIIVDNSTFYYNNNKLCEEWNIHYISMQGNKGLSKAYNVALNYICQTFRENDLVIWFDDDTQITKEYFTILDKALSQGNKYDVFAPFIYGQNGKIYSPNNSGFLKNKLLKSITDNVNYNRFNAINSCLAVRVHLYKNYRYDERLFLDSVDHNFFDDLREKKMNFKILPTSIQQNFFQREIFSDGSLIKKRLEIRITDLMIYSRKKVKYTLLGVIKACGWGLLFGLKCKSFSVLLICIKHAFWGLFCNIKYFINYSKAG